MIHASRPIFAAALAAALGLALAAPASAETLYDARGFEAPAFRPGPIDVAARGEAWRPGIAKPQPVVVDTPSPAHGQALRIYGPLNANSNNIVSFEPAQRGVVVVSFDILLTTNWRSLNLTVVPERADAGSVADLATSWLAFGFGGEIRHYTGGWRQIATYELNQWHHVDLLLHLTGDKAGTLDVNLDGGDFEAVGLPWRNELNLDRLGPLAELWLIGQGRGESQQGGTTQRYAQLDNLVITRVAENLLDDATP